MSPVEGPDLLDEDGSGTVFRDVVMLALCGFVAIVLLLLPHLNPPTAADQVKSPGNVIVEIRWPDDLNTDVDLWVEAPGDMPVGYSNKGGGVFNLLRDYLGHTNDLSELNYEMSYSRGVPAGSYTVNVHLYRNKTYAFPVPVTVVVTVKDAPHTRARQILKTEVSLRREGEEITAFRFALNEDGTLVTGSVNSVPRPLRSRRG